MADDKTRMAPKSRTNLDTHVLEQPGSVLDTNKTNTEKNMLEFYPVGESSSNVIPLMPGPLSNT